MFQIGLRPTKKHKQNSRFQHVAQGLKCNPSASICPGAHYQPEIQNNRRRTSLPTISKSTFTQLTNSNFTRPTDAMLI
eukprot:c23353_g1_i4 orf=2-232(-)